MIYCINPDCENKYIVANTGFYVDRCDRARFDWVCPVCGERREACMQITKMSWREVEYEERYTSWYSKDKYTRSRYKS